MMEARDYHSEGIRVCGVENWEMEPQNSMLGIKILYTI